MKFFSINQVFFGNLNLDSGEYLPKLMNPEYIYSLSTFY